MRVSATVERRCLTQLGVFVSAEMPTVAVTVATGAVTVTVGVDVAAIGRAVHAVASIAHAARPNTNFMCT
jgi:hypothetical protein